MLSLGFIVDASAAMVHRTNADPQASNGHRTRTAAMSVARRERGSPMDARPRVTCLRKPRKAATVR
jgi:hypothetical protein